MYRWWRQRTIIGTFTAGGAGRRPILDPAAAAPRARAAFAEVAVPQPYLTAPLAQLSAGGRLGEPEPWEHGVLQAGHGAHLVTGEGEGDKPGCGAETATGTR